MYVGLPTPSRMVVAFYWVASFLLNYDRQSMPGLSLSSRLGRTRLAKRVPQPDAKRSCSHKSQQTLAGSWPGVCYGQVLFCVLFVFFAWVLGDLFATQVQCKTNRAETLLVHCFLCDYGYFIPRVGLRYMRFSCRIFLAFFTNFSEANKRRWSKKGLCAYSKAKTVLEGHFLLQTPS